MRLPTKRVVDKLVMRAKKTWGLDDWEVTWEWADLQEQGVSDPTGWTERRVHICLDRATVRQQDRRFLNRLILHEIGHAVLAPTWRGVTDWIDDKSMIPAKSRERRIFEEMYNTRENEILDHIIVKVMGL